MKQESDKMQLHIRGSSNYILEFATGNESLAELKAQVSEREGSEDVLLYVAGKPVDYEMPVSSIGEFHVDVTVPLLGGKVHGSLARAGKVRGQTPKVDAQEKKKKKTDQDELKEESNTTDDSSMLSLHSVEDVDQTPIYKSFGTSYNNCFF